jgi:endonuclease/exonuclease/phosphatase family metal-dependent hydrolase
MALRRKLTALLAAVLASAALAPATADAATELRVMTWNIHGEDLDVAGVAGVIRQYGIDVVTVQEIHRRPEWDQVRELADALGWQLGAGVHFGRADNPGPCDDEWPGDAGNAVLSRYPIVERVTKPLSPDSQDCPVKRSLAGVRLDVDGTALRVFTSHLSPGTGSSSVALRQAQARTIADYLTQSGPILFTGDLNDRPGSTVTGYFTAKGWLDTGGRYADDPTLGTARIDYIWAKAVTVLSGQVPSPGYSDHRPVVMNIRV